MPQRFVRWLRVCGATRPCPSRKLAPSRVQDGNRRPQRFRSHPPGRRLYSGVRPESVAARYGNCGFPGCRLPGRSSAGARRRIADGRIGRAEPITAVPGAIHHETRSSR